MYLLDSTLRVSFFYRDYRNEMKSDNIGAFSDADAFGAKIYTNPKANENFCPEKILFQDRQPGTVPEEDQGDQIAMDSEKYLQKYEKKRLAQQQKNDLDRKLSVEVTFEVFKTKFYRKTLTGKLQSLKTDKSEKKISAAVLWSEIMCEIKGSARSHFYPGGYVPLFTYLTTGSARGFDKETLGNIYKIYNEYESWKSKGNFYDLMDLVMFAIKQIRILGYQGPKIHFMMVDEIQDLTFSMIYLINLVSDKLFFFTGDNAQNIAKGVNYKFGDLVKLFDKTNQDDMNFEDYDRNCIN